MTSRSYAIISCVHGRPAITEAWAKWIAAHHSGPVAIAGDDPTLRERCEFHFGNNLLWTPYCNTPLGAKWNRVAERAVRSAKHCVILGSDDFPSPELFDIWEHIASLKYRWCRLNSIYFYHLRSKEVSQLTSSLGFGTGRMFPTASLANLFELQGFAWHPWFESGLDASLYSNLGCPEDDVVLSSNESCWILAMKTENQVNSYKKIRKVHPTMSIIKHPHRNLSKLIDWLYQQPGVKPTRKTRWATTI